MSGPYTEVHYELWCDMSPCVGEHAGMSSCITHGSGGTQKKFLAAIKRDGWKNIKGEWLCPACVKALRKESK